jgi:hypothetical protein
VITWISGQLDAAHCEEVNQQIACLSAFARRIHQLKPTAMEFAYLKTIAFTANDLPPPSSNGQHGLLGKFLDFITSGPEVFNLKNQHQRLMFT